MGLWKLNRGHTKAGHQHGEGLLHERLLTSMASEIIWGCWRIKSYLPFFLVRSRLLFDCSYGHCIDYYGLRGWTCTRRWSAPWVWLWDFLGWHNWITFFLATSKLLTSLTSEVVWGHLRPFNHKILFAIFKSSTTFDCSYGHCIDYYGLRGWTCSRRRSAPWVWLRLFAFLDEVPLVGVPKIRLNLMRNRSVSLLNRESLLYLRYLRLLWGVDCISFSASSLVMNW